MEGRGLWLLTRPRGASGASASRSAHLALLAGAAALYGTRLGIGLSNDSVNYLRAARGLLDGHGLIVMQAIHFDGPVPMTHWPPLYPLLLAGAGALGLDPEAFARGWNALLFSANVLLIGGLARRHGASAAGALFVAGLFVANLEVLRIHQMAWTEPTYFFTTFLALGLLARHLEMPSRAALWGAGACAALALLTRYIGIAVVAAGGLGLLLLSRERLALRVRDAIQFGVVPGSALALWWLRNRMLPDEASYEHVSTSLPAWRPLLEQITRTLAGWLWPFPTGLAARLPGSDAVLIAAVILGAGVALTLLTRGALRPGNTPGGESQRDSRPALRFALYALCHLAFLYGTVFALFPIWIPDPRHLSPAVVALLVALACIAPRLTSRAAEPRHFALALGVALAALLLSHSVRATREQTHWARTGLGFREARFAGSDLIELARELPPGTPVFSNTLAVAALARMPDARWLPARSRPQHPEPNPRFAEQMGVLERELRERHGVIIVFARDGDVFPNAAQLEQALPLRLLLAVPEGRAYSIR